MMHPLVRDLYKRVLIVGRDYPTGLQHVKERWKKAIFDHRNCPSCYNSNSNMVTDSVVNQKQLPNRTPVISVASENVVDDISKINDDISNENDRRAKQQLIDTKLNIKSSNKLQNVNTDQCQEEILHAVYRGRRMIKDMIGVIQLKKYRSMKQRYSGSGINIVNNDHSTN